VTAYFRRHAIAVEDDASLDGLNQAGYAHAKSDRVWLDQAVFSQQLRLASREQMSRLTWFAGAGYLHAIMMRVRTLPLPRLPMAGR